MVLRVSLIIVLIGIAYLSLTPLETVVVGNDKISHFIAYSVLMFNAGLLTFKSKRNFRLAILICLGFGALIEVVQHFVPGRFMSGYDMIANSLGVLIGTIQTVVLYKPVCKFLRATRII